MRSTILLIPVIILLTLVSCDKEEFEDCPEELDIKAQKMEQIGSIFDAIARQPQSADVLISVAEMIYTDYTELLPLSDKAVFQRGKARGTSFGLLFSAIARNPSIFNKLDDAALKFLGAYHSDYISDELLDITKTYAIDALFESISRQPEADSLLNLASKKYLNYDILAHLD